MTNYSNYIAGLQCMNTQAVEGGTCVGAWTEGSCWWPSTDWIGYIASCNILWRNSFGGNIRTCRQGIYVFHGDNGAYSQQPRPGYDGTARCNWVG